MSDYQVNYESEDRGSKVFCQCVFDDVPLTIESAFHVAAIEAADAFFENGGGSYDATDIGYTVQPQMEG